MRLAWLLLAGDQRDQGHPAGLLLPPSTLLVLVLLRHELTLLPTWLSCSSCTGSKAGEATGFVRLHGPHGPHCVSCMHRNAGKPACHSPINLLSMAPDTSPLSHLIIGRFSSPAVPLLMLGAPGGGGRKLRCSDLCVHTNKATTGVKREPNGAAVLHDVLCRYDTASPCTWRASGACGRQSSRWRGVGCAWCRQSAMTAHSAENVSYLKNAGRGECCGSGLVCEWSMQSCTADLRCSREY